ncbi:hypothetical protein GCM10012285_49630 [Streptomyces kronopolitis]|uniref:Uncharacterized protein n=1 Tax=Streptomyces kronopolitis TaxID=1612435 RepID=A0ABQ2JUP2_9ACTN|nr:hypothetical protein GCM10012285_49630 [Streptomyces kronopolitis]
MQEKGGLHALSNAHGERVERIWIVEMATQLQRPFYDIRREKGVHEMYVSSFACFKAPGATQE